MHIQSNETSISTALELLEFIEGGRLRPVNPRLVLDADGTLTVESALHPLNEGQVILLSSIEPDSFGDGWEDALEEDMIEYLRQWDQPNHHNEDGD